MTQSMLCCSIAGGYCRRCDVLVGLPGVRVVDAVRDECGALTVTVESELDWTGCYECRGDRSCSRPYAGAAG